MNSVPDTRPQSTSGPQFLATKADMLNHLVHSTWNQHLRHKMNTAYDPHSLFFSDDYEHHFQQRYLSAKNKKGGNYNKAKNRWKKTTRETKYFFDFELAWTWEKSCEKLDGLVRWSNTTLEELDISVELCEKMIDDLESTLGHRIYDIPDRMLGLLSKLRFALRQKLDRSDDYSTWSWVDRSKWLARGVFIVLHFCNWIERLIMLCGGVRSEAEAVSEIFKISLLRDVYAVKGFNPTTYIQKHLHPQSREAFRRGGRQLRDLCLHVKNMTWTGQFHQMLLFPDVTINGKTYPFNIAMARIIPLLYTNALQSHREMHSHWGRVLHHANRLQTLATKTTKDVVHTEIPWKERMDAWMSVLNGLRKLYDGLFSDTHVARMNSLDDEGVPAKDPSDYYQPMTTIAQFLEKAKTVHKDAQLVHNYFDERIPSEDDIHSIVTLMDELKISDESRESMKDSPEITAWGTTTTWVYICIVLRNIFYRLQLILPTAVMLSGRVDPYEARTFSNILYVRIMDILQSPSHAREAMKHFEELIEASYEWQDSAWRQTTKQILGERLPKRQLPEKFLVDHALSMEVYARQYLDTNSTIIPVQSDNKEPEWLKRTTQEITEYRTRIPNDSKRLF